MVAVSVTVTAAEPGVAAATATQLATTAATAARISGSGVEYAVVPGIETHTPALPAVVRAVAGAAAGLAGWVLIAHRRARHDVRRRRQEASRS